MIEKLPTWMTSGKNQEVILKTIGKLERKQSPAGNKT